MISVIDVAKNLGKQKAYVFKLMGRLGIETVKEKSNDARGQKIAYIATDDYDRIREYLAGTEDSYDTSSAQPDEGGVFYLLRWSLNSSSHAVA